MHAYCCSILHPCSSSYAHACSILVRHGLPQAHVAKFAGVGHVSLGAKQPTAVAPEGERKNCWWSSMDNSCKGWSPNQRGPGRSSAGTASTPRFLDRLLASSPASQKSILVGTSRSAFEARSISFACSVRRLYFRLRWWREGNNALGVRVWGGCKREERAERQASTNQTRSADGAGSFYRPQDLSAQRSCLSLGSQRTVKHTCSSRYSDVC